MENTKNWDEIIAEKDARIAELEALVKHYEELFHLAQHRRFCASSEKTNVNQLSYFYNESEVDAAPLSEEPEYEEIRYKRRKRKGKRKDDLSSLPVETINYTLPEDERICPEHNIPLHVMGHEKRQELKVIPARVVVVEHCQEVYSCRVCEKESDHVTIMKAPVPAPVIRGSLASPSAVAHIMTQKFVMCSPLYRQELEWGWFGVRLSRQTMSNWVIKCAFDWLTVIYVKLRIKLLESEILHADETTLQVLCELNRAAQTRSYMWLYRTSGDAVNPVVLYEYQETREAVHPQTFLAGFKGYVHTDGYQVYHSLIAVIIVACWSHMRRKFEDALKVMPAADRKGSNAQKGEAYCTRLFDFERKYAKLTAEERYEKRQVESKPVAEEFFAWAGSIRALPKSLLGEALTYAANQREWLMNVYLDGRLELSNNRAERSIKPFVTGRKNWLFCNTPNGADASAIVYSIIETARENGLKPFEYLKYLLEKLPNITTSEVDALGPWSEEIPEHIKMPTAIKEQETDGKKVS